MEKNLCKELLIRTVKELAREYNLVTTRDIVPVISKDNKIIRYYINYYTVSNSVYQLRLLIGYEDQQMRFKIEIHSPFDNQIDYESSDFQTFKKEIHNICKEIFHLVRYKKVKFNENLTNV